jgi:hypothetical protein
MLRIAAGEAFEKEMSELPSEEELNKEYKPSPELDRRIDDILKDSLRKSKRHGRVKKFRRAAACVCVFFAVSAAVLMSVSATRTAIFNAFMNIREKYTEIQFKDSEKDGGLYRPAYLPEGFSESSNVTFSKATMLTYTNEAGEEILFTQAPADTGSLSVDNETMTYLEVKINGEAAYLFVSQSEDDINILVWETNGVMLELTSKISSDELVKIAENIKYQ